MSQLTRLYDFAAGTKILSAQVDAEFNQIVASNNSIDTRTTALEAGNYNRTTADISYYVDGALGNDANNGLTTGTPLRTITAALALLPRFVDHTVTINVSAGTYVENVVIEGFMGKGTISLIGGADLAAAASYTFTRLTVSRCAIETLAQGFTASYGPLPFTVTNSPMGVTLQYVIATAASGIGVTATEGSVVYVIGSSFSNKTAAIRAQLLAKVYSSNNAGSSNSVGLNAQQANIYKSGTQPAGTTSESTSSGGVIA